MIKHLVRALHQSAPSYSAILGPGGVGKTCIGTAVLHHPRVVSKFGRLRWFISCEALLDADSLKAALASLFGVDERKVVLHLKKIAERIESDMLLVLDNLETIWESLKKRPATEELLLQLTGVHRLSLLVTLRGAERPSSVPWSRPFLPSLPMLDLSSAKAIFVSIADIAEDEPGLEELLNAIDCLPLAITLLATQTQYVGLSTIIALWHQQKTAMVTRGLNDRLSSLDVSIAISLASERLARFPGAFNVLQVLSLLPDGIAFANLEQILPNESDEVTTLLQLSLAYRNTNRRIQCLAPIREYILYNNPPKDSLFEPVLRFHCEMGAEARGGRRGSRRDEIAIKFADHVANIQHVLLRSMELRCFYEDAINAVLNFCSFANQHGSFLNFFYILLTNAIALCREHNLYQMLSECLREMSQLLSTRELGNLAWYETLDEAVAIARKIDHKVGLKRSLIQQANFTLWIGEYNAFQVQPIIEEANSIILSSKADEAEFIGPLCLVENELLRKSDQLRASIECLSNGLERLSSNRDDLRYWGIFIYYRLANTYIHLGIIPLALSALENALRSGGKHNSLRTSIWSELCTCYLIQSRLIEAEAASNQMLLCCTAIQGLSSEFFGVALQHQLATIDIAKGRVSEALSRLYALETFQSQSYTVVSTVSGIRPGHWSRVMSFRKIARAELLQGNPEACRFYSLEALCDKKTNYETKLPAAVNITDYHIAQGFSELHLAIRYSILGCVMALKAGDMSFVAALVQRIGDVSILLDGDIQTARSCYEATFSYVRYQGLRRHLADCLMRLGLLHLIDGKRAEAGVKLSTARRLYAAAEDPDGCRYCDARLEDCQDPTQKVQIHGAFDRFNLIINCS